VQDRLSRHSLTVYVNIQIYRQFCNFASCSVTVRPEHRMRVLENRVLGVVFGVKGRKC